MPRKARHLYILDDSKKKEFNIDNLKKKITNLRTIIKDARDDNYKTTCNLYAISMGYPPPNILSYEKK